MRLHLITGMVAAFLLCVASAVHGQSALVVRGPYLQLGTPSSMVVRWRTDVATDSRVLYGPDPTSLIWAAVDGVLTTEHEVILPDLAADTTYSYAVGTSTIVLAGGDTSHFFVTPPMSGTAKPARVWILGDSGAANSNAAAVRDAYSSFAGSRYTDLWLMLGDNAYEDGTDAEYQAAVFDMYPTMLRQSVLWPTLGNHDRHSADSATQTGPYYDLFTLPTLGEAGGLASGTEAYYSFDYGNIHFICLDSSDTDVSTTGAMMTWLQSDLATTLQPWIVAFWHHPPYSKGSHDSDSEGGLVDMRENAVPILEAGGVDLVLSGHSHSYERSFLLDGHYGPSISLDPSMILDGGDGRADGTGAYGKPSVGPAPHEGTVYVVAGSSGSAASGSLDHPVMFRSLDTLGSLVLDVVGMQLDATFIDSAGATRDYFTLVKNTNGNPAPVPPSIVAPPSNLTVTASAAANFTVEAVGDPPLSQWRRDGVDLRSETGVTYVLSPTALSDDGALFDVVVSNAAGSVTSATATLTVTAPVPVATAVLVRATPLWALNPPSPDSAGITYITHKAELLVSDSEVNEIPAIFDLYPVNLFPLTVSGAPTLLAGVTTAFSQEPTGVSYDPVSRHLFVSDDDRDEIYELAQGPDDLYGTADDPPATGFDTAVHGNTDAEGVAYDPDNGHLYVVDGDGTEVYDYETGPDGQFGTSDDPAPTHFDVARFGATDPEGITYYAAHQTLLVLDRNTDRVYEVSLNGASAGQIIDIGAANALFPAGLTIAPASGGGGDNLYFVTRGIDNDTDPNENDGWLYEMDAFLDSGGGPVDLPPMADAGMDQVLEQGTVDEVVAVPLDGSASTDDGGVDQLAFSWAFVTGPDPVVPVPSGVPAGIQASADLSVPGVYTYELTVTDQNGLGTSRSDQVQTTIFPPVIVREFVVAAGGDDVEERATGSVSVTSSDLELVLDNTLQTVGLRFVGVDVPQGAAVVDARIQFRADEVGTGTPLALSIWVQDSADAPPFVASSLNVSSRLATTTPGPVTWMPDPWPARNQAGAAQRTPNLGDLLQPLFVRPDWAGTGAVVVMITGADTLNERTADSFEGGWPARLQISYTTGGGPIDLPPVADAGVDQVLVQGTVGEVVAVPLDGSGSTDDGGVDQLVFSWAFVDGPDPVAPVPSGAPLGIQASVDLSVPGLYTYELTVTDQNGLGTLRSGRVQITIDPPGSVVTREFVVAAGGDDVEERATGSVSVTSSDLELVLDNTLQTVGLRFVGVDVPQGAAVVDARVQFRADEVGTGTPLALSIWVQDSADAPPFVASSLNVSSRLATTTPGPVTWMPDPWPARNQAGAAQRTPNLGDLLQPLFVRPDWAGTGAVVVMITGADTLNERTADSFEGGWPARLQISYTTGGG